MKVFYTISTLMAISMSFTSASLRGTTIIQGGGVEEFDNNNNNNNNHRMLSSQVKISGKFDSKQTCGVATDCAHTEGMERQCIDGQCKYILDTVGTLPTAPDAAVSEVAEAAPVNSKESSFNITAAGPGKVTGTSYSFPAHSTGTLTLDLHVDALTSQEVQDLSHGWYSLLKDSYKEQFNQTTHKDASASANLSFFGFFSGGGKAQASYSQTTTRMHSIGLTNSQIDDAMNMLADAAKVMNTVKLVMTVDNTDYDYSVSGDLYVYVMSGYVKTSKETHQFRVLSNGGQYGNSQHTDNAHGTVIPLA